MIGSISGALELLLLRRHAPNLWWCLARPARSLNPAVKLCFPDGLEATIIDVGDQGLRLVEMANEALMDKNTLMSPAKVIVSTTMTRIIPNRAMATWSMLGPAKV